MNQESEGGNVRLNERLGALADKLELTWTALDDAVDWGQDCMGYALQAWDWKYGEYWRNEESKAIRAKADLKDLIYELRHGRA